VQRNQFVIKGQGADLICFIDVFDKKRSSTLIFDATIVRQIDCLEKKSTAQKTIFSMLKQILAFVENSDKRTV